jgi:hypothetical protein
MFWELLCLLLELCGDPARQVGAQPMHIFHGGLVDANSECRSLAGLIWIIDWVVAQILTELLMLDVLLLRRKKLCSLTSAGRQIWFCCRFMHALTKSVSHQFIEAVTHREVTKRACKLIKVVCLSASASWHGSSSVTQDREMDQLVKTASADGSRMHSPHLFHSSSLRLLQTARSLIEN